MVADCHSKLRAGRHTLSVLAGGCSSTNCNNSSSSRYRRHHRRSSQPVNDHSSTHDVSTTSRPSLAATKLAKKDQDSRVVFAWCARRCEDAARDGRRRERQYGSGRCRVSGGGPRQGRQHQQRALYSLLVRCTGSAAATVAPEDVKYQVLSECHAGGSSTGEECSSKSAWRTWRTRCRLIRLFSQRQTSCC